MIYEDNPEESEEWEYEEIYPYCKSKVWDMRHNRNENKKRKTTNYMIWDNTMKRT